MNKLIPNPITADAQKCISIRKRSKRGESISREDLKFCEKMLKKYPGWYTDTQKQVFNETVPFGSYAHLD